MTLRARWNGDPPVPGDYLMSTVRPKNAYRITKVTPRSKVLELECDRLPPSSVPEGATVHAWRWDARTKQGAAWAR